jgi:ClpP class serine protease
VETISIGKYAELFSTTRGFTEDEAAVFEHFAQQAYTSFVTKAAASRNMTLDSMQAVAQGRVWTGRQAKERGLVDHTGGLWKALHIAQELASITDKTKKGKAVRVQVMRSAGAGGLEGWLTERAKRSTGSTIGPQVMALCAEEAMWSGLLGSESQLGLNPTLQALGQSLSPVLQQALHLASGPPQLASAATEGLWQRLASWIDEHLL